MPAPTVTVWCVPIAACLRALGDERHWLSHAEGRRASRMAARTAARFVVARSALRRLLAARLDRPAASIGIVEEASGRPRLADGAASFNIAHSGDLALVAVASGGRLGVDVEALRAVPTAVALASEVLGVPAAAQLERLPPPARSRAFLAAWTAHEARAKANGHGLGQGHAASSVRDFYVVPLTLRAGYVGALASDRAGAPRIADFDPSWLGSSGGGQGRLHPACMESRP